VWVFPILPKNPHGKAVRSLNASEPRPASRSAVSQTHVEPLDRVTWRRRIYIVALIAFLGCAADLLTKRWVFQWLGTPPDHQIYWLWEHYVGLETSINTGALWGLGSGHTLLLAGISILATLGIIVWIALGGAVADRIITLAVGMILGGVWGNLYDRLGLWGAHGVRDWIRLQAGTFVWPNFNIADSLLVCGSALLLLHAFRGGSAGSAEEG
jgi:signal peptidase II